MTHAEAEAHPWVFTPIPGQKLCLGILDYDYHTQHRCRACGKSIEIIPEPAPPTPPDANFEHIYLLEERRRARQMMGYQDPWFEV